MEEKLGPVDFLINCAGASHAEVFEVGHHVHLNYNL